MKGRRVPPPPGSLAPDEDTVYFAAHPIERHYTRPYRPGEWPEGNSTPEGAPFVQTLVVQLGPGMRAHWFFADGSTESTYVQASGTSAEATDRASNLVQRFMQRYGGNVREVYQ
jgi:hypothetical protein